MKKREKSFTRKLAGVLAFLFTVAIAGWGAQRYFRNLRVIEVKTEKIRRGIFLHTVTSTSSGTIKAERKANISSRINGRVTRIDYRDGDRVQKGETIIFLDPEEVEGSAIMAEANLVSAKVRYEQMKMAYELEKKLVRSRINETKANMREAESFKNRAEDLYRQGIYSIQQLDKAKRNMDVAKAEYNLAVANRKQIALKEKEVLYAQTVVKQNEAALGVASIKEKYVTILAPFDGIIYNKNVELGEMVLPGAPLMEIVDDNSIYIHASIDEADIYKVNIGQKVTIVIDAFPSAGFSGVVYYISPIISEEKQEGRAVEIKISIDPHKETLRPGMSCDIQILIDEIPDALMAPTNLIVGRGKEKYVYVVNAGRVKKRKVTLGISNWDFSVVKKGLRHGEEIISSIDIRKLKERAPVIVKND